MTGQRTICVNHRLRLTCQIDVSIYMMENTDIDDKFRLTHSERTKQDRVRAETCCHLGVIYNKQGDFESAKNYFEQCFNLAKSIGDSKLLDHSRVLVGIATGNQKIYGGNNIKNNDILPPPPTTTASTTSSEEKLVVTDAKDNKEHTADQENT